MMAEMSVDLWVDWKVDDLAPVMAVKKVDSRAMRLGSLMVDTMDLQMVVS